MIRPALTAALSGLVLAACQTAPTGTWSHGSAATPMDGKWASSDGVFVATFQDGNFTSRFTRTNEVLAQGSYSVRGSQVEMRWLSVATQQQRSASCTISGPNTVQCRQAGAGGFDLQRTA